MKSDFESIIHVMKTNGVGFIKSFFSEDSSLDEKPSILKENFITIKFSDGKEKLGWLILTGDDYINHLITHINDSEKEARAMVTGPDYTTYIRLRSIPYEPTSKRENICHIDILLKHLDKGIGEAIITPSLESRNDFK
ncbi:MAG: hypothetical protein V4665_01065 [Patescibacteria group bacterium]